MPRQIVSSADFKVPVPGFSQAVIVPAQGKLLFISGITARRADGTIAAVGDVVGQTRQVMENMKGILAAAGAGLDDVVRITRYVRDMNDELKVFAVLREYFGDAPPASTVVQIARLFDEQQLVEIEATAVLPGPG